MTVRWRPLLAGLLATSMLLAACFGDGGSETTATTATTTTATTVEGTEDLAGVTATTTTGEPLFPDLRAGPIGDLSILEAPNGVRFLFFSTSVENAGSGPLRVLANNEAGSWTVEQGVRDTAGRETHVSLPTTLVFGEDGTERWLLPDFVRYQLSSSDEDGTPSVRSTTEVAVCLSSAADADGACGGADSSRIEMALPPDGKFDLSWFEPGQGVDMTGLPSGTYRLEVMVDPRAFLMELDRSNNVSWVDFELRADDGVRPRVEILE